MASVVYVGEGCTGCKVCMIACSHAHDRAFGLRAARIFVVKREPATDYPVTCRQCGKPLCKGACPVNAIEQRDGLVTIDEDSCIGCGTCVEACPFGAITIHPSKRVAIKCDLCGGEPACIRFCPANVLKLRTPAAIAQVKRGEG